MKKAIKTCFMIVISTGDDYGVKEVIGPFPTKMKADEFGRKNLNNIDGFWETVPGRFPAYFELYS